MYIAAGWVGGEAHTWLLKCCKSYNNSKSYYDTRRETCMLWFDDEKDALMFILRWL